MKKTDRAIHQPYFLKFLLLAILVTLIGSSTAAYGQQFFDSLRPLLTLVTSRSFRLPTR